MKDLVKSDNQTVSCVPNVFDIYLFIYFTSISFSFIFLCKVFLISLQVISLTISFYIPFKIIKLISKDLGYHFLLLTL